MAFKVRVEGFAEGAVIPRRLTCDGADVSPPLNWEGEPEATKSFALIADDPDAPGCTWNHWLLWDIPASVHSLHEGTGEGSVGKSGTNDFGKSGYGGPCPPRAKGPHRYFFRLFALDTKSIRLPSGAKRTALEKALRKHAIAEVAYMGRYERT
jgi:Raf kinase inhibitor-like YbhB/YbcL family protein